MKRYSNGYWKQNTEKLMSERETSTHHVVCTELHDIDVLKNGLKFQVVRCGADRRFVFCRRMDILFSTWSQMNKFLIFF